MGYSVYWHPKTRKFLYKLPKETASRIIAKVKEAKENPFHFLEHYEGEDCYKLRIGDYRALIDVNLSKKEMKIMVLGHRKNIYKKQQ